MRTKRLAIMAIIAGCQSAPVPTASSPAPSPSQRPPVSPPTVVPTFERGITPRQAPPLPPVPLVEGRLSPRVVFPEANQALTVRDSNFIFGSIGNGRASLTINGAPVKVAP